MAIEVAGPAQETGGSGLSRVTGPGGAAWDLALACSMLLAARGSAAAVITRLGAAGFLLAWHWQRSGKIVTGARDQRL